MQHPNQLKLHNRVVFFSNLQITPLAVVSNISVDGTLCYYY